MENQLILPTELNQRLERIESLLISQKDTMNFKDVVHYTGWKPSYLYKLTSQGKIPCYSPNGKTLFFNRKELDLYLQTNGRAPKLTDQEQAELWVNQNRKR